MSGIRTIRTSNIEDSYHRDNDSCISYTQTLWTCAWISNESLIVVGNVDLTAHTAKIGPILKLATNGPFTAISTNSAFSINLLDGQGKYLARYPFEPQVYSDTPANEH